MKFTDFLNEDYLKIDYKKLEKIDDISTMFRFPYKTYEDLMYYIHDDKHLGNSNSLKDAIKYYGEINDKTLYRGCSDKELASLLKTGKPNSGFALSFSESYSEAKKFGPNVITVEPRSLRGFCLWKFYHYYYELVMAWCKVHHEDPENFIPDPEYWHDTVITEKEWVFDRDTEWVCINEIDLVFTEKSQAPDIDNVYLSKNDFAKRIAEVFSDIKGMVLKKKFLPTQDNYYPEVEFRYDGSQYVTQDKIKRLCTKVAKELNSDLVVVDNAYPNEYSFGFRRKGNKNCYCNFTIIVNS